MRKILSALLIVFAISGVNAYAQIAAWNPSGLSGYGPSPFAATTTAANVTVTGLARGAGVSTGGSAAGNAWGGSDWQGASEAAGLSIGDTIRFTIKANAGYMVSLSNFQLFYRRSSTGASMGKLQYSLNGGGTYTDISGLSYSSTSSSGASLPAIPLSGITALQNVSCATTIIFRIINWGGTTSSGTWYVFNSGLSVSGSVASYPAPVVLTPPSGITIPVGTGTTFTVSGVSGASSFQWQRNTSGISGGTWVDITSATMDPTGTYSGYTTASTATSNTLTLASVPASWDGYGYRCVVTNCSGSTTSGAALLNVSSGTCSGMPLAGSAVPTVPAFCGSGSTTMTLAGGTSGGGITYQWSSSATSTPPGTDIPGATSSSYVTPSLSGTTYYWCTTTCAASTLSNISGTGIVTIDPLPVIVVPGGDVCAGGSGLSLTATGASTYTWVPATGLSATTGATVTANPVVNTTYTITGTSAAGCTANTTATVNYHLAPTAMTITPTTFTACQGAAPQLLTATGGLIGPTSVNSGVITIPGSIAAFGTIANGLTIAGVPAGAVITGATVNVINFGSQYQDDYIINIKAPNGNVLNLIRQRGSHTSTVTTLFANTQVSSAGATSLASGSGTFTGLWMADAVNAVGAAPYLSNVTSWGSLYTIPNGTWSLSIYNNTGFVNTVLTSAQWSITLEYSYQAPVTWSPVTDLYTDAAATVAYTGTPANNVYFNPATVATTVYTATATNATCTSAATTATTVNALPGVITGAGNVCTGYTITLGNAVAGGTWTSSNTNASVDPATGVVTGAAAGTSDITYTLPAGCYAVATVTVNTMPPAITGTLTICEGATTTLSNSIAGGTWTISNTNASVDAMTGVVTGNTAGASTVTYTLVGGCNISAEVTVNAQPGTITGVADVCEAGGTTTLSNPVSGGTWASSNTNASIDVTTGVVTGNTAGTATITYTLPAGCYTTTTVTVNQLPATITGTFVVCQASMANLFSSPAGGVWSSNNANSMIDPVTGIVTGSAPGTSVISYVLPTGCYTTAVVTVNMIPAPIAGPTQVCFGSGTWLSNSVPGGTWTSGSVNATVGMGGSVFGASVGTATISYTLGNGCMRTTTMSVNVLPSAITGGMGVCVGYTSALSSGPAGGSWTSSNSNSNVNPTTGIVTGVFVGTSVITYTLPTGCLTTANVTVNSLPAPISGPMQVCLGATQVLTSATAGGTWSSSNSLRASVDIATGAVSGLSLGTANISYTLGSGCVVTATVTVAPIPPAIMGVTGFCAGSAITLSNSVPGGTWASSNTSIAAIDATTGVLTGVTGGLVMITYTTANGCYKTGYVSVNPTPGPITGLLTLCTARTTMLYNATPGGLWISGNTAVATISASGPLAGATTGVTAGTASITYSLPTGCFAQTTMIVNASPAVITGFASNCIGSLTTLGNAVPGGVWSSNNTTVAPIDAMGTLSASAVGTAVISYTLMPSGCYSTASVTVNNVPAIYTVTGGGNYCAGSGGSAIGLLPSQAGIKYTLVYGTSSVVSVFGTGSGITFGSFTPSGTYTVAATDTLTGCQSDMAGSAVVSVTPMAIPAVSLSPASAASICAGGALSYSVTPTNGGTSPTYVWRLNGAVVGGATSYSYVPANGDILTVKMTSNAACRVFDTATAGDTATVIPIAVPVVYTSATPNDTVCELTPVTYIASGSGGGTTPYYAWKVNGTWAGTGSTLSAVPVDNDNVVCMMVSNAACRTMDTVYSSVLKMEVLPKAVPVVNISASPGTTVNAGTMVAFTANVVNAGGAPVYQWYVNSVPVPGGTLATFSSSSLYNKDSVSCEVTSTGMCSGYTGRNGAKVTVVPVSGIAITGTKLDNVGLVPNPNNGVFRLTGLKGAGGESLLVTVTSMLGQVVFSRTIDMKYTSGEEAVELSSELANGMYILNLSTENDRKGLHFVVRK